ncbi:hypothetical protein F7725_009249 [Dissostichus mawsoni]|uniref:Uncharacterized protein n=1 Tax=Dissostichus mawsoni TaxID=36200 RepID=A0A7J5Z723_DISMA|nr:hypothetical protein F7725_009249 [Dissostichus mawsoni]
MALLDIVGVWIIGDRREQEPGLQLVHHLKTVTDPMNQSVLRLTVSTRERELRLPFKRDILYATLPLDIVGVWTVRDSREQEPELQLVHSLKTVTDQWHSLPPGSCTARPQAAAQGFFCNSP